MPKCQAKGAGKRRKTNLDFPSGTQAVGGPAVSSKPSVAPLIVPSRCTFYSHVRQLAGFVLFLCEATVNAALCAVGCGLCVWSYLVIAADVYLGVDILDGVVSLYRTF